MVAEGKKHYPFHLIFQERMEIPEQRGEKSSINVADGRLQGSRHTIPPAGKGNQAMGGSLLAKDKISKSNRWELPNRLLYP